ncbi:hypothetical protein KKJ05_21455, partial [Xenorhabdus bovienii]|nr:hypothetical protein [Xenorhabdus bovienii]
TQAAIRTIFHFIAYYDQFLGLKSLYSWVYLGRNGRYRNLAIIREITTTTMGKTLDRSLYHDIPLSLTLCFTYRVTY